MFALIEITRIYKALIHKESSPWEIWIGYNIELAE